ncbi:unnamed protein product, partial [Ascophyllum nodosum]
EQFKREEESFEEKQRVTTAALEKRQIELDERDRLLKEKGSTTEKTPKPAEVACIKSAAATVERRTSLPGKRQNAWGISSVRLLLAGLFIVVGLWLGLVFRLTAVISPQDTRHDADSSGRGLRFPLRHGPGEVSAETRIKNGVGRVVLPISDGRGLSGTAGAGPSDAQIGPDDRDAPADNDKGARKSKEKLLQTAWPGIDFKGGDLDGVGPIDAANEQECRHHCERNGDCLKWTLELEKHYCWLKGEGGERREAGRSVVSGTVRTKADTRIRPPQSDKNPPPPPLECCPASAAQAPPGVHDLDLWDDQPGSDWSTSYPLGNGHLGAMLGMGALKDTVYLSDGSLWAGKGKTDEGSDLPPSPDRFKEFVTAREALLKGDIYTAQDAAGRMPTEPKGFVSSFEYAGELELEFDAKGGVLAPDDGSATEGYVRHLHLNNATAEASFWSSGAPRRGPFEWTSTPRRHEHHREAFASYVDGVLAMRLTCREEGSGQGCLSLDARLQRAGKSYATEAWELPPLASTRSQDRAPSGRGAYLGLFRPTSESGAEMGFHVCVAILPRGAGETPAIKVEEFVQEPVQPKINLQPADVDALAAARAAHDPLTIGERKPGLGKAPELPTPPVKRHRLHLPADGAHAEALVLTSIVTEGEWADGGESRKSRTWVRFRDGGSWGRGENGQGKRRTGWQESPPRTGKCEVVV